MQLPRGTFNSIKKNILLHALLEEIESQKFSGYCTVTSGDTTFSIVFKSGMYMLADYEKNEGEAAWNQIRDRMDQQVDAALTSLTNQQLELCVEFNEHAVIPHDARRKPQQQVKPAATVQAQQKPVTRQVYPNTVAPKPHAAGSVRSAYVDAPDEPKPKGTGRLSQGKAPEPAAAQISPEFVTESDGGSNIDRDLDALEAMDLEEMTKKIRDNCKITVERLHLEHLLKKMGGE
jgi:hypothetical protein